MRSAIAVVVAIMISGALASASDADANYSRGNQAYQNGNYETAIEAYSQILETG